MPRLQHSKGFTLLEMLVAVLVVGLVVTTFFQLFGASLRLEHRGRGFDRIVIVGEETFALLRARDLRKDDFPWSGEREGFAWKLQLEPIAVEPDIDASETDSGLRLRWPSELYRLIFLIREEKHPGRHLRLVDYLRVAPNYFSDDFKKEHLSTS